ncbi:hypothetical protein T10_8024 [Trichinella papuae]|uniref:Uncharacterized protein n=1 Tax=Trichinella papuae TaxID=268474 RepID=A0A0V1MA56_9BILA|nr:hypothetical protein T10_8024 [Trichinella papuae]
MAPETMRSSRQEAFQGPSYRMTLSDMEAFLSTSNKHLNQKNCSSIFYKRTVLNVVNYITLTSVSVNRKNIDELLLCNRRIFEKKEKKTNLCQCITVVDMNACVQYTEYKNASKARVMHRVCTGSSMIQTQIERKYVTGVACVTADSWVKYFRSSFYVVVSKQRGNGRRDKADNSRVLHAWLLNVQITFFCCLLFGIVDDEDHSLITKIQSLVQPRPSCGPLPGFGSNLGGASDPRPDWLGFVVRPGRLQSCPIIPGGNLSTPALVTDTSSVPPVVANAVRANVEIIICQQFVLTNRRPRAASAFPIYPLSPLPTSQPQCLHFLPIFTIMPTVVWLQDALAGPVWSTQAAAVSLPYRLASLLFKFPFRIFVG